MPKGYELVAQRWATYNEVGGVKPVKKHRSMSFSGSTLYSYNTAVACYHTSESDEKYVLWTDHKYSMTTSGHLCTALSFVTVKSFSVPIVGTHTAYAGENLASLVSALHAFRDSASKKWNANSWRGEGEGYWRDHLAHLWGHAQEYAQLTNQPFLGYPVGIMPIESMIEAVHNERNRRRAKYEDPKAVATRERAKARAQAKEALGLD